jgi:putative addiction module component (TIGR02574 family)
MDIKEIKKLSIAERISIIGEIWESIDKGGLSVTDSQKLEIQERIERYKKGETKFFTWDEIMAELNKAR